ncbi:MAG: CYTH domain-containing protein [Thermodesulfobacteriota bacterium]
MESAFPHQEIEATLAICSDKPEATAARIAGLTALAGHRLDPKATLVIRDRYFDSAAWALARADWGLRVRECSGELLVALKGPARITECGAVVRPEIEGLWAAETLGRVSQLLRDLGVITSGHVISNSDADPLDTLTALGLRVIQDRFTRREVRDVLTPAGRESPIAELVVDTVTYTFQDLAVQHLEVEIEAKADGSSALLATMVRELLTRFGDALRVWEHNKLATGLALGHLHAGGELAGLLVSTHTLAPRAYDRLVQLFASGWTFASRP